MSGGAWWSISEKALLEMLRRVAAGEDPDMVYAEAFANSHRDRPEEDADADDE
jgi:hypothetical protein